MASGLPRSALLLGSPRSEGQRFQLFARFVSEPGTLIFYESPERVAQTVADPGNGARCGSRAVVARELTRCLKNTVGERSKSYRTA